MLSMLKEAKISVVKGAVAAGKTAVSDAAIIDMQGFERVLFLAVLGDDTEATAKVTLSVIAGDKSDLSDGAEHATKATHAAESATSADGKAVALEVLKPVKRYLRPKVTRETADANLLCVLAIQFNGDNIPVSTGDVIASALVIG